MSSSSSVPSKKMQNKGTSATRRATSLNPPSPYRVVTADGVITSPLQKTIPQYLESAHYAKQQAAARHANVRQKIIGLVEPLPAMPTSQQLAVMSDQKLSSLTVQLITADNPLGPNPELPIEALLTELETSSAQKHVQQYIQVDEEMLLAGLQSDAIQNPSTETSTSSSLLTIVPQTSAAAVASQNLVTLNRSRWQRQRLQSRGRPMLKQLCHPLHLLNTRCPPWQ